MRSSNHLNLFYYTFMNRDNKNLLDHFTLALSGLESVHLDPPIFAEDMLQYGALLDRLSTLQPRKPVVLKWDINYRQNDGIECLDLLTLFFRSLQGKWFLQLHFVNQAFENNALLADGFKEIFNAIESSRDAITITELSGVFPTWLQSTPHFFSDDKVQLIFLLSTKDDVNRLTTLLENISVYDLSLDLRIQNDHWEDDETCHAVTEIIFLAAIRNPTIRNFKFKSSHCLHFQTLVKEPGALIHELDLSDNQISGFDFFNQLLQSVLSRVTKLTLNNAALYSEEIATILTNTAIKEINLRNNHITNKIFYLLSNNASLDAMDLCDNKYLNKTLNDNRLLNFVEKNTTLSHLFLSALPLQYDEALNLTKLVMAYRKNPVLKIHTTQKLKPLDRETSQKNDLDSIDKKWVTKRALFKLFSPRKELFDYYTGKMILEMADISATRPPTSFLHSLEKHKKNIELRYIGYDFSRLFYHEERRAIKKIETALIDHNYEECLALAEAATQQSLFSINFRMICRELTGILQAWQADSDLTTFSFV